MDILIYRNFDFWSCIIKEIKCLQTRYEKLEDQCKNAVKKFTKMIINDPSFDFLLMKSCEPMIQVFCPVNIRYTFLVSPLC